MFNFLTSERLNTTKVLAIKRICGNICGNVRCTCIDGFTKVTLYSDEVNGRVEMKDSQIFYTGMAQISDKSWSRFNWLLFLSFIHIIYICDANTCHLLPMVWNRSSYPMIPNTPGCWPRCGLTALMLSTTRQFLTRGIPISSWNVSLWLHIDVCRHHTQCSDSWRLISWTWWQTICKLS